MSRIIFLHGASSSGKSTLASEIRRQAITPFVHLSLDHFRDSGAIRPETYPDWPHVRPQIFEALHRSFAAFADAGCDLIIEHILDTEGWHDALQTMLAAHDVVFVGLHTPDVVLRQREMARGDRTLGSAVADAGHIHSGLTYDLELDGTAPVATTAERILRHLAAPERPRSAFFQSGKQVG